MNTLLPINTKSFIPPFCPNPNCTHHQKPRQENWWNHLKPYSTRTFGEVPRFYCRTCRKTFSAQTFKLDYYCKKVLDYSLLHHLSSESVSVRALSRLLKVSRGCIINRSQRLGRQCLALHSLLRRMIWGGEMVAIDGIQSFDVSQYFPNNLTLSVTHESLYVLEATHCTLRRSGRMTEKQKEKRRKLEERFSYERGAVVRSFREVLDQLAEEYPLREGQPLIIITDEKKEYERALRSHILFKEQGDTRRTIHIKVSSKAKRNRSNLLFPCNYFDREIRKDQAAHRRETACHCRNVNNGMLRLWSYLAWHNYWKRYPIKGPSEDSMLHGQWAGLNGQLLSLLKGYIYKSRVFLSRIRLSPCGVRAWLLDHTTPLKEGHDYVPAYVTL